MKKIIYGLIIVLLIFSAWLVSGFDLRTDDNVTKLNVSYRAEEEFNPELATIVVGVKTTKRNVKSAFEENNQKVNELTDTLNSIEGVKLKTLNFRVNPITREEDGKRVVYYDVLNQVEIKTSKLNDLGSIIQQTVSAGANQITSIQYSLKNNEEAEKKVTEKAIQGIRSKVKFAAENMGKKVVKIDSMNINDQLARINANLLNFQVEKSIANIPPISPQNIKVSVNINATALLR